MAIAQKVAGYSLGKADLLRRAMGKKKKSVLDAEYVGFEAGMKANGFSDAAIKTLWDILVPFADYAFNKAHSAAYGLVSYWTALPQGELPGRVHGRACSPASATTRTSRRSTWPSAAAWASRCCRRTSTSRAADFTAVGNDIRFGLAAVRNVGHNVVDSIVAGPRGEGRLQGLRRLPAQGRRGRLQQEGHRVADQGRRVRLAGPHAPGPRSRSTPTPSTRPWRSSARRPRGSSTCSAASATAREADDPFGGALDIAIPDRPSGSKSERLAFEREMLGLYVSDHPLLGVEHVLTSHADTPIAEINAGGVEDGANVTIAGILTAVVAAHEQAGRALGDRHAGGPRSGIEVLFFPKTWAEVLGEGRPRPDRRGQGADQPPRRPAVAVRLRGDASPSSPRARAGRCWSPCRRPAAPRRWSSGCARCSAATRAPPRCS